MTTPDAGPSRWSAHGLRRLATAFVAQEHVGILGGLLLRLARYLQGDPSAPFNVQSAGGGNSQLPDNVLAFSAVFVVTGGPILVRLDGGLILANDMLIQAGSVVTLTGQPTIKGFRFTSPTAATVSVVGQYFD